MDSGTNRLLHFYRAMGVRELFIPPDIMERFRNEAPAQTVSASPRSLEELKRQWAGCTRCRLAEGRKHLVFGEGDPKARLMFVGEGPGRDEDLMGRPFVGAAGELLTKIIQAMGLDRTRVYITNIVKCRPPRNRTPFDDEIGACEPCLLSQIQLIQPEIICALGAPAAQTLLHTDAPISTMRGRFHDVDGIRLMPTYHPAYLLRTPAKKREVWEDVQLIMGALGLNAP